MKIHSRINRRTEFEVMARTTSIMSQYTFKNLMKRTLVTFERAKEKFIHLELLRDSISLSIC